MVSEYVLQAAARFHRDLQAAFPDRLRETRLFGSFVRGGAREESDVDLLVVLSDVSPEDRSRVIAVADRLSQETGLDLSPLIVDQRQLEQLRGRGSSVYRDAFEEGIPL